MIERHSELGRGGGEQVIVNIGNDREPIVALEPAEGRDGICKRRPVGQRIGSERTSDSEGTNPRRSPKPCTTDCKTSR